MHQHNSRCWQYLQSAYHDSRCCSGLYDSSLSVATPHTHTQHTVFATRVRTRDVVVGAAYTRERSSLSDVLANNARDVCMRDARGEESSNVGVKRELRLCGGKGVSKPNLLGGLSRVRGGRRSEVRWT